MMMIILCNWIEHIFSSVQGNFPYKPLTMYTKDQDFKYSSRDFPISNITTHPVHSDYICICPRAQYICKRTQWKMERKNQSRSSFSFLLLRDLEYLENWRYFEQGCKLIFGC